MIEKLRQAATDGTRGFETFYRQYDEFRVKLSRWHTGVPFVQVSVLICSGNRGVRDNGDGFRLIESVTASFRKEFPETQFVWSPGWSGGNPRGWDMWLSIDLGTLVNQLDFDQEEILFLHQSDRLKGLLG